MSGNDCGTLIGAEPRDDGAKTKGKLSQPKDITDLYGDTAWVSTNKAVIRFEKGASLKQAKVRKLEREIDQLVYKLYELAPEEIKIVEEFNNG